MEKEAYMKGELQRIELGIGFEREVHRLVERLFGTDERVERDEAEKFVQLGLPDGAEITARSSPLSMACWTRVAIRPCETRARESKVTQHNSAFLW